MRVMERRGEERREILSYLLVARRSEPSNSTQATAITGITLIHTNRKQVNIE
jgi:hypothetical protein